MLPGICLLTFLTQMAALIWSKRREFLDIFVCEFCMSVTSLRSTKYLSSSAIRHHQGTLLHYRRKVPLQNFFE